MYSRITFTKSPLFFVTTFSTSLTNLMVLLPHYMTAATTYAEILAPPLLRLQKHTDIRTQEFARYSDLCQHPWLANVTCT